MRIEQMEKLLPEQALLLLTGRLTFKEEEVRYIQQLIEKSKIDWFEFFKLTMYHKTYVLCWRNLNKYVPNLHLPKYLNDIAQYVYNCTQIRNIENEKMKNEFMKQCKKKSIVCIPVKGICLISDLYEDYGIRYSGDMDFLVRYDDIQHLKRVMDEMGFINGVYKPQLGVIEPITRREELKWKMYMSNLHPYLKLSDNEIFPYYKMDFRYALDDRLDKEPIREIIYETVSRGYTLPAHFLVHLCTHFYNEAKHSATISMAKDVNMIKLCDIREYIFKFVDQENLRMAIKFAEKYDLLQAIYYTVYCLNELYTDGYEEKILKAIKIENKTFLNTYGDSTIENMGEFDSTFLERFFGCGANNEVNVQPKLFVKLD